MKNPTPPPRRFSPISILPILLLAAFCCLPGEVRSTGASGNEPLVVQDSLPNGLRLVFVRVNDIPLVELNMVFDAGLGKEPEGREGLAQLVSRLIFAGTPQRTRAQIAADLDILASTMSSFASFEYAQIYTRSLARNFSQTADILADICMNTRMEAGDIESERTRLRSQIASIPAGEGEEASRNLVALLFGSAHPLTRSILGTDKSLATIGAAEVAAFYRTYYRPNNATLIVTGNIDFAVARTILLDKFSAWTPGEIPPDAVQTIPPPAKEVIGILDVPALKLAQYRFGYRAMARNSPRFYPSVVFNYLFGEARDSRLGKKFWQEHLVHPEFTSGFGFYRDAGYFVVSGFGAARQADSIPVYFGEAVAEFLAAPIGAKELALAKATIIREWEDADRTNRNAQKQLQELVVAHVPPAEAFRFPEGIRAVSAEDVTAFARWLFGENRRITIAAGDAAVLKAGLEKTQNTEIITIDRPGSGKENGSDER